MNHSPRPTKNKRTPEDMLMALDQLDQTLEVMSLVINRLRHELQDTPTETPVVTVNTDCAVH